jgi:hypothetical protein
MFSGKEMPPYPDPHSLGGFMVGPEKFAQEKRKANNDPSLI